MLIMDTDSALREKSDSRSGERRKDSHLYVTRESAREASNDAGRPRSLQRLNNGVGWIEVVRPGAGAEGRAHSTSQARFGESTALPFPHDELASARGVVIGVALGLFAWGLIAAAIAIVFF